MKSIIKFSGITSLFLILFFGTGCASHSFNISTVPPLAGAEVFVTRTGSEDTKIAHTTINGTASGSYFLFGGWTKYGGLNICKSNECAGVLVFDRSRNSAWNYIKCLTFFAGPLCIIWGVAPNFYSHNVVFDTSRYTGDRGIPLLVAPKQEMFKTLEVGQRIHELDKLKESKQITDEEYSKQRSRILENI
jgi:hypothetical protein